MPHLLHPTHISHIRFQAELENIYDKTNGFIRNTTETNSPTTSRDTTAQDNLNAFKTELKKLFNGITAVDQLSGLYTMYSIGNIVNTKSKAVLQHLTIELPGTNNELDKVVQQIRKLIKDNLNKSTYSLVTTDAPKDTCTSIVYELRCPVSRCGMCYVGRTHKGKKECLTFITKNCDSKAKHLLQEHMKKKHKDKNQSTINNWQMTKIASSCEDNKLKILESLHVKKLLLSGQYLLNTSPKKRLTVFQYTKKELAVAKRYANKSDGTYDWGAPRSDEVSFVLNDSIYLTLLQLHAEFENFYDKTKRFITSDEKNNYINFLRLEYNEIAVNSPTCSSEWQRVGIADIVKKRNTNNILQHLNIELPIELENTGDPYSKFKAAIRERLRNSIDSSFESKTKNQLKDTRTSIIYLMKCKRLNCKRDLYIGRTHVGKIRRHMEHTIHDKNSAVYQHCSTMGHTFPIDDMEILEVSCDGNKLQFLEALYIKEYLLNAQILKGKDGILNKEKGKKLSLFDYTDEEKRAEKYLNIQNNAIRSGVQMAGGRQDTYELHHYDSENDSSEYDEPKEEQ